MDLFVPKDSQTKSQYIRIYVPSDLRQLYGKKFFCGGLEKALAWLWSGLGAVSLDNITRLPAGSLRSRANIGGSWLVTTRFGP
jgi:hypothetical protein